jgi:hypothetical protein
LEQAALDRLQQLIEEEVTSRFPGVPIAQVRLLQYGDDPVVEPGEIAVRVFLTAADGEADREEDREEDREQVLQDFGRSFHRELQSFREDLSRKLPEASRLEFSVGDDGHGPHIMLNRPARSLEARALAGGDLTPVMARLGPTDLETLDTLITAGIAGNRADAVRWALARIRERPAYERLRARALEIEELKAQF